MQLYEMVTVHIKWHVATLYFTISSFINISSINDLSYRRSINFLILYLQWYENFSIIDNDIGICRNVF